MPLEGEQLIIRCHNIHDIGRHVGETLSTVLESVQRKHQIYGFKSRVKPAKKILQKVYRNRQDIASFDPDHVWDGFAGRYITLFEEQRFAVIQDLFEALENFK